MPAHSASPTELTAPDALVADEPDFVQGLQGFARFCESMSRGTPDPADMTMLAAKFRDAAFVISEQQKLRDELRAQVETLTAERDEAHKTLKSIEDRVTGSPVNLLSDIVSLAQSA